ncbi:recombinase family protein [Ureibacillus chungkukjangi]|uniref:DNA invertase Pin-like site-specific DNA recombinase n=1 Tax=Ureibacillus chungkukjangi TaxID=1202712 RepID=A0A318TTJ4_9BACL|nr:recombinase family protein [Ureibacillus chungkukjangi]MCM3389619.1 recombinase family protein [Ureibacillus chungkukjangi]PYF06378.1 DNA invertase Pin-like site-specific DNA recombinase [Ureibacillus chungkukjangi]
MIYGYIRPLYNDEDCNEQLKKLSNCEKIYKELHGSPKKRVELEKMLMALQKGDIILVERMVAIADTTRHLIELLKLCDKDGVTIQFINEEIESKGALDFTLTEMLDHLLAFQTDIVKQSTTLGLVNAKEQGKSIGRPKKSNENIKKAIAMYDSGNYTLLDIKNETGISKSTLYRYLESVE